MLRQPISRRREIGEIGRREISADYYLKNWRVEELWRRLLWYK